MWDEVEEEPGTSKFLKLGNGSFQESQYNTLTDVPLHSLLREYIRAEKDDDGEPHSQLFNEDQPIDGEPSAKVMKKDFFQGTGSFVK